MIVNYLLAPRTSESDEIKALLQEAKIPFVAIDSPDQIEPVLLTDEQPSPLAGSSLRKFIREHQEARKQEVL